MTTETTTRKILDFQNIGSREFHDIYLKEQFPVSNNDERIMAHMFFHEYTSRPHVPVGPILSKGRSKRFDGLASRLFSTAKPTSQKRLFLTNPVNINQKYTAGNDLSFGVSLFGTPNPEHMMFSLRYGKTLFILENPAEAKTVALSGFSGYRSKNLYLVEAHTQFEITKVEKSDILCSKILFCQKAYQDVQVVYLRVKKPATKG